MRTDVDVDEPGTERWSAAQFGGEDLDGALEEDGIGAGQVDEIGGVDRDRGDVVDAEALDEGRQFDRRRRPTMPRRRVVAEDLDRVRADSVGAVDRLDHAAAEGQVGADPSVRRAA